MNWDKIDMAYAAGIMDGDGSFSIIKLKSDSSPLYYPFLQFVNRRKEIIDFLKMKFGGNIIIGKPHICKDGSLGNVIYRWRLRSGRNVKPAIEALLPYLKIKKDRAQFLLEFINKFPFIRGKTLSNETLYDKERDYLKMISLNDWTTFDNTITTKLAKEISQDELFWSYTAGLMDTDGSFSIKKQLQNKGTHVINPRYLPIISLSMTDTRAVNYIRENFPYGKFYIPQNKSCTNGFHYQFGIYTKKESILFLEKLIPFLRAKKENAKILLNFCINSKNTSNCRLGIPIDELKFRESCYQQLINQNKYGVVKSSLMDLEPLPGSAEGNKAEGESHRERSKREDHESGCGALNIYRNVERDK